MKRCLSLVVIMVMILCAVTAAAESSWTCPNCGQDASGNFCMNCGTARPEEDGSWYCPNCGAENEDNFCSNCGTQSGNESTGSMTRGTENLIRLDLNIQFEKNSISSTYNAKMFIDDEYIATLDHGTPYQGSILVTPGNHTISFEEDGSSSVNGSKIFMAEQPTQFFCVIHAKWDHIEITGERTTIIDENAPLPGDGAIYVNGDLKLEVEIEFERNMTFSKYDVDMYLDNIYVTTLPHGNDFKGVLGVSSGNHVLIFYKAGDKLVRGTSEFSVNADAAFSCKIEATRNKVNVSKEKIR